MASCARQCLPSIIDRMHIRSDVAKEKGQEDDEEARHARWIIRHGVILKFCMEFLWLNKVAEASNSVHMIGGSFWPSQSTFITWVTKYLRLMCQFSMPNIVSLNFAVTPLHRTVRTANVLRPSMLSTLLPAFRFVPDTKKRDQGIISCNHASFMRTLDINFRNRKVANIVPWRPIGSYTSIPHLTTTSFDKTGKTLQTGLEIKLLCKILPRYQMISNLITLCRGWD